MLYPIELRLHGEQVNKSSFARGVKPDFLRKEARPVRSTYMKAVKPDSLLPFAIAAILGFLVLGLRGERSESSRMKGPSLVLATPSDHEGKPEKKLPDLRAQLDQLPSP